jgi:hypothetical protein
MYTRVVPEAVLWFDKKEDFQRLNLDAPKRRPSAPSLATPATQSIPLPNVDPARLEAINHRAKQILDSGRIPEWLFVCQATQGLLMFQYASDQKPVMLLFSSPFAASDYLRATGTPGTVHQLKVETLPQLAQSWLSLGLQTAVLDRCPRCPQFVSIYLAGVAKWSKEDFANVWAHLSAPRSVLGEIRVRSALTHIAAGSHAEARRDLEYVRDHFDWLIGAVPPIMLKTEINPDGLPMSTFDGIRAGVLGDRSQFFKDLTIPFYGYNKPDAKVSQGVRDSFWLQGMQCSIKGAYDCIKAFSETDFTYDLKKMDVPTLILHGDADQIVPIGTSALMSAKLVKNATLKIHPGASHGMCTVDADQVNADLLAFLKA